MRTALRWLSCWRSVELISFTVFGLLLLELTGPGGQHIEVNRDSITSLRVPRGTDHFGPEIHCIVFTDDGKFIGVQEDCTTVARRAKALDSDKQIH